MELIKLMEFMKTIVALFAETFVPRPAQSTQQIQFQSSLWEWEDWIELLVEEQWAAKRMQSWRKVKRIENSWAFAEAKHEARRGAAPFPFSLSQQSFLFFSLLKKRLKDCGGAEREWKGERHKEGLVVSFLLLFIGLIDWRLHYFHSISFLIWFHSHFIKIKIKFHSNIYK